MIKPQCLSCVPPVPNKKTEFFVCDTLPISICCLIHKEPFSHDPP